MQILVVFCKRCFSLQEPFDIGLVKAAFELCLAAEALDMDQYVYAYKELSRFFRLLGSAFGFVAQDVDDKIGILEKHRYHDVYGARVQCRFSQRLNHFFSLLRVYEFNMHSALTTSFITSLPCSASDLSEHYATIDGMLKYETDSGLADSGHAPAGGKLPSGARTLLRLHRALEFVVLFLGKASLTSTRVVFSLAILDSSSFAAGKVKEAPEESGTSGIARESYDATLAKYHPWLIRKGANMAMYLLPSRKTLVSSMCKSTIEETVRI